MCYTLLVTHMNIPNFKEKIKPLGENGDFLVILVVLLSSLASFGLGRLSVSSENEAGNTDSVIIQGVNFIESGVEGSSVQTHQNEQKVSEKGEFVASKNGTKYYKEGCDGAKRILEENKIWFQTQEEAELSGYEKSSTCDF